MQDYEEIQDDRAAMSYEEEMYYEEQMQGALHRAMKKQLEMGWIK
jgi:hypothetical protein